MGGRAEITERAGRRSKRTDRIASLRGYTVARNGRKGWRLRGRREKWSGGWMRRVWAVLTLDLAKAGPFIIGSHQALLPVMWWKMGSNAVICFMLPALLRFTDSLLIHTLTHTQTEVRTGTSTRAHKDKCIQTCINFTFSRWMYVQLCTHKVDGTNKMLTDEYNLIHKYIHLSYKHTYSQYHLWKVEEISHEDRLHTRHTFLHIHTANTEASEVLFVLSSK